MARWLQVTASIWAHVEQTICRHVALSQWVHEQNDYRMLYNTRLIFIYNSQNIVHPQPGDF